MHLQVTPDNMRRLSVLASLSEKQFAEILDLLEHQIDNLSTGESLLGAAESLKHSSSSEIMDVADATFPLLFTFVADGQSPKVVADGVISGVRTNVESKDLFTPAKYPILKKRLISILGNRSIGTKAKASALVVTRGTVMTDVKIITDVRPIFTSSPSPTVEAFTVIHTMVMECVDGSDRKVLHIALDKSDLNKIKMAIDRANYKDKAISKLVSGSGVAKIEVT